MKKLAILLVVTVVAAFGLAACGGDDDEDETTAAPATTETTTAAGGGGAGGTVDLSAPADNSFAYDQKDATAPAGTLTINFDNPATLSHDVVVADEAGEVLGQTDLVSEGTASTSVELQPGTYTYYCDVPGHREGGMEGTLTVN